MFTQTTDKSDDTGCSDLLLNGFTLAQKQYIVANLYPTLTKTLVHFIGEAKRMNQIEEKLEIASPLRPEGVT